MKPLFLAFGVWCIAFTAALLGLLSNGPGSADLTGRIILDYNPFCRSFIVETNRGFVVLDWEDGILVFAAGDTVTGPLHSRGLQSIDLVGYGAMLVTVDGWSPDLRRGQEALRVRCPFFAGTALAVTSRT
jgi:hypothetical protein